MGDQVHSVALVVHSDFGKDLVLLAKEIRVWLVDTPKNRAAANPVWKEQGGEHSLEHGVTLFNASSEAEPDEVAASMIGTIDEHHGQYSHTPPCGCIRVYGCGASTRLVEALAGYGYTTIVRSEDGFSAGRSGEDAG